jgi:hypothetical protein
MYYLNYKSLLNLKWWLKPFSLVTDPDTDQNNIHIMNKQLSQTVRW